MTYLSIPLQVNPEALAEEMFAKMEAEFPGWTPKAGNLETILIRSIAYVLVQPLAQLAADVADEIFYRYGEQIVKVLPHEATRAGGKVKITFQDTAGYSLPSGYVINVPKTGSEAIPFRTTAPATAAPGSSSVSEVPIEAVEPGTDGNKLAAGTLAEPVEGLIYVTKVEITTETSGGAEAEEPGEYLSRLVETMQTLAPRPILARDVAILARGVSGVYRAAVIDNYNAETKTGSLEKTTSVGVMSAEGKDPGTTIKNAVKAELAAKREANYVFIVVGPKEEGISVKATVVEAAGYSHAEAVAQTEAAIKALLLPSRWGTGPTQEATIWENTTVFRFQDAVTAVNNCQAVDHYSLLEIKKGAGAYGVADITFTEPFPVPKLETLTVT